MKDMTKYKVIFGYFSELVEVEEPTTNYGTILDLAIDQLESDGCKGVFVTDDDIERDGITDDAYITGGNHGLNLYHGGNFMIEQITE